LEKKKKKIKTQKPQPLGLNNKTKIDLAARGAGQGRCYRILGGSQICVLLLPDGLSSLPKNSAFSGKEKVSDGPILPKNCLDPEPPLGRGRTYTSSPFSQTTREF
jgi:hypothetical protein